jgi:hypothetical protein
VRSRIAVDISAGERMGAGSRTGAELMEAAGPDVTGGGGWCAGGGCCVVAAGAPVEPATEVMGRPEDIISNLIPN